MKNDVISKAKKIIQRMSVKSDGDEKVLKRISEDKEDLKIEIMEKTKSIQLLSEQLTVASKKQSHDRSLLE